MGLLPGGLLWLTRRNKRVKYYPMKKLPIGIQTFRDLREEGYVYVDKTAHIAKLINEGKYYFISRPRRFGKSLLLSTLKEIFLGNRELFKGLYIYDKVTWDEHPVVYIDYSVITYSESTAVFKESILEYIKDFGRQHKIEIRKATAQGAIEELIRKLSAINKVVILIDEYDKPIIDYVKNPEKAKENREVLREIYSAIKGVDPYLRFVFITGVSKFSKVSIFSGLNNLLDITLDEKYSTLLGIEQEELVKYFGEEIKEIAEREGTEPDDIIDRIREWYNGYSWNGIDRVYNPTSILTLFSQKRFSNYWFATGTPTFLIDLIMEYKYAIEEIEEKDVGEYVFESYDIENMELNSLMFQTGYLTVKRIYREYDETIYTLSYPNREVKDALINHVIAKYLAEPVSTVKPKYLELMRALDKGDIGGFMDMLRSIFASIPYTLHLEKEAYYHSLFYMMLSLMGCRIDVEILTDKGRIDGVLIFNDKIYIIEFKLGKAEEALKQIKERRYYERYLREGKEIILLGVGGFLEKDIHCLMERAAQPSSGR